MITIGIIKITLMYFLEKKSPEIIDIQEFCLDCNPDF
jgi:hypothetical protein